MSKRRRSSHNKTSPKNQPEALPADHGREEPKLVVAGVAFQKFDAWVDEQLESLVGRWVYLAAPAAATIRRVVPHEIRRKSGQA